MTVEEDYEGNVDSVAQETSRAAEVADEDLAREVEDQAAESQDAEDPNAPMFVYTGDDGKEVQLTAQDILDALSARDQVGDLTAKVQELETKGAQPVEKPVEPAKVGEVDAATVEPVAWEKVGTELMTMLEEERSADIGPALQGVIVREFATNPFVAQTVAAFVNLLMDQREQGVKKSSAFQEFVGGEPSEAEIAAFMKDHPFCETKKEAILSIQLANARTQGTAKEAAVSKDKDVATKKAASEAAKKLIATKKAAGTLRLIGGASGARAGARSGKQVLTGDDRVDAAVSALRAMRSTT